MEFRLLGPLEVADGRGEVAVGGGRRRALLAILLVHRNEVVPADRLIDELWDGGPPASANKALQVHVSQLRKDLGSNGTSLRTRAGGYVLEVEPASIDVARFEQHVRDGERARADGRDGDAADRLREGLQLWRGPPLVDFAYAGFAQDEIARLDELRLAALEERIEADSRSAVIARSSRSSSRSSRPTRCVSGCAASSCSRCTAAGARRTRSTRIGRAAARASRSSGSSRARGCATCRTASSPTTPSSRRRPRRRDRAPRRAGRRSRSSSPGSSSSRSPSRSCFASARRSPRRSPPRWTSPPTRRSGWTRGRAEPTSRFRCRAGRPISPPTASACSPSASRRRP